MKWSDVQVRSMPKTILNYHDLSNWVSFLTKTKQDNDVTNRIGLVYIETEIELSGPIYRYGLWWKWDNITV